jgi:hypothetical protein
MRRGPGSAPATAGACGAAASRRPRPGHPPLLAGRLILPGNGFTSAHGYPPLSLDGGPTLRAAVGSVLCLALTALLGLL